MTFLEKRDSDSGRSPSDDEKKIGGSPADLPPDPDAGLSEEERAKIVRFIITALKSIIH